MIEIANRIDMGCSVANAEYPNVKFLNSGNDRQIEVVFIDLNKNKIKILFNNVAGFKWQEMFFNDSGNRDDCTYEIINSKWLDNYYKQPAIEKTKELHHFKLCFNTWGPLEVIATSFSTTIVKKAKMEQLNLQKLNHLASISLINGIQIHFDSILLYKNKSYSTSYFLAILALEEIGKAFHVDHFWWSSKIDGRASPEDEQEWLKTIFNHKSKQKSYARFFDCIFVNKELMEDIDNGSIDLLKQNSIYVGIGKKRLKSDINDEINNPLKMTSVKPKEVITFTNTKLIEFCLLQIKGIGEFDSYAMEKVFNPELYYRLNREWPNIDKRYKKRIKELEKFEYSDDK